MARDARKAHGPKRPEPRRVQYRSKRGERKDRDEEEAEKIKK